MTQRRAASAMQLMQTAISLLANVLLMKMPSAALTLVHLLPPHLFLTLIKNNPTIAPDHQPGVPR